MKAKAFTDMEAGRNDNKNIQSSHKLQRFIQIT